MVRPVGVISLAGKINLGNRPAPDCYSAIAQVLDYDEPLIALQLAIGLCVRCLRDRKHQRLAAAADVHRTLTIILQVQWGFVVVERRLFRRVPTKQIQFSGLEVFRQLGNLICRMNCALIKPSLNEYDLALDVFAVSSSSPLSATRGSLATWPQFSPVMRYTQQFLSLLAYR